MFEKQGTFFWVTQWGIEPASPVSVNRHAMLSTIIHPQKRCIKVLRQTVELLLRQIGKRQCCLALDLMHSFWGMYDGREHSMSVD